MSNKIPLLILIKKYVIIYIENKERGVYSMTSKQKAWLSKNGFNDQGETWCLFGTKSSYDIKDKLKELGFKYNPVLKWHAPQKIEVADFHIFPVLFSQFFEWNENQDGAYPRVNAAAAYETLTNEFIEPSNSEFVGTKGERLYDLPVTLLSTFGFNGNFGYSYLYKFDYNGNILVWITQTELNAADGSALLLTGTVKMHNLYRKERQTYLSRCKVTKR